MSRAGGGAVRSLARGAWRTRIRVEHLLRRAITAVWYRALFARVGPRSAVYKFSVLLNPQHMKLGARVLVRSGCRFEVVLHGQAWAPELSIGDDVNIEQNVHIVCHDRVIVGDRVSITGGCAIVDVTHPHAVAFADGKIGEVIDGARSYVEIGEGSFVGYGAIILPNVRIGRGCVVGAGSVVTKDVPDFARVAGVPARIIG